MTFLTFKLDQLFILLVPDLVGGGAAIFPSESKVFQKSLSVWSNFVIGMIVPLLVNPLP